MQIAQVKQTLRQSTYRFPTHSTQPNSDRWKTLLEIIKVMVEKPVSNETRF